MTKRKAQEVELPAHPFWKSIPLDAPKFKPMLLDLAAIEDAIKPLGLDEAASARLLNEAQRETKLFAVFMSEFGDISLTEIIGMIRRELSYVEQAGEDVFNMLVASPRRDDRRKAEELACKYLDATSEVASYFKQELTRLESLRPANAANEERALLWKRLKKLWMSFGGRKNGKALAEFIYAVCTPPAVKRSRGAPEPATTSVPMPVKASIVEWLRLHKDDPI